MKTAESKCRWCGWHLAGVVCIAFGITLLTFFPSFFHNQLLKVSQSIIYRREFR